MGRDDADLVEDLVRGGVHAMGAQSLFQCSTNDSDKRLDRLVKHLHRAERAAPDHLPGDDRRSRSRFDSSTTYRWE